jgi:hypothetical protein
MEEVDEEPATDTDDRNHEFTDSSDTGLRSGKGTGLLRRLLLD